MAEPTIGIPHWATNDVVNPTTGFPNVQEPPLNKVETGFDAYPPPGKGDAIPRQWFNWLFRSTGQWIEYLRGENIDRKSEISSEISNRTTDVNVARASLLKLGNDIIDGGAGLTPYASLSDAETDSWSRFIQAIVYAQDHSVQFRNSADAVIGTGTVRAFNTMASLVTLSLPPINATHPDLIRIYGSGGASLPGEMFPLTPTTPTGSAVVVFAAPMTLVANGARVIGEARFIYSSDGTFPTRHIAISIPGSGGTNNGWFATSIAFPSLVPNPIGT